MDLQWYDENHFASCSADGTIHSKFRMSYSIAIDTTMYCAVLATTRASTVRRLTGHSDEVNAIRFDPTKTLIASSSDDKTVRIWSLAGIVGPNSNLEDPEDGEDTTLSEKKGGCLILNGHAADVHTIEWVPGGGKDGRPRLLAS